jgi:DNA invertase Pin-like site-specific DNA recombinase
MKARYNRISTSNQSLERQLAKQNPDEVLYNDVVSGSVAFGEREKGEKLIEAILSGEVNYISVSSIDRLGRNMYDIIKTLSFFEKNEVTLKVDNLGLESIVDGKVNPTFNLITSVMANVSQMEREALLERQREGVAIAKAKGVYKGRAKGTTDSVDDILFKYKNVVKHLNKKQSLRNTAKLCNVSLGTVQKVKSAIKEKAELN